MFGSSISIRIMPAIALAALAVTACTPDRVTQTGSLYPHDYRDRHPIVLREAPQHLDVIVRGTALDPRQRDDVKSFAHAYRSKGGGAIAVQVPRGGPASAADATLADIRSALAESGISGRALHISSYQPANPAIAAPIRLSYRAMTAQVDSQCGLWPQDLGVGDAGFNLRNEPYWNLGCATQSNVASQISDPVDLVRGRTAGAIDPIRRTQNIENLRQGNDPSTSYRQDGQNQINQNVAR